MGSFSIEAMDITHDRFAFTFVRKKIDFWYGTHHVCADDSFSYPRLARHYYLTKSFDSIQLETIEERPNKRNSLYRPINRPENLSYE